VIVLSDNDILRKLAMCDLFEEFLVVYGLTDADVQIAKRTRFYWNHPRQRKRLGEPAYGRLSGILERIRIIESSPDPAYEAALAEQTDHNIDAGEAILFALCPAIPDSFVATGDKRSIIGLMAAGAENPDCAALCAALEGRIICFEMIVMAIVRHYGFSTVREKLISGRECDRGLSQWLGSQLDADEDRFLEGLNSFLRDIRNQSAALLATR